MADVRTYGHADGTTWPVPADTEWHLRYGVLASYREFRLHAASIVAAYAHLVDPDITEKDAIESLKRARRAVADRG